MKKALYIIFCFLYLASSAGVNLNLHYCGGKLKNISFAHAGEKDCCGKKMKSKNCCKEKHLVYKVKETPSNGFKISLIKNETASMLAGSFSPIKSFKSLSSFLLIAFLKEEPDIVYSNSYLVNRVFRI